MLTRAEQEGQQSFLALARKINDYLTDWWGEHILQTDQDCLRSMECQKKHQE